MPWTGVRRTLHNWLGGSAGREMLCHGYVKVSERNRCVTQTAGIALGEDAHDGIVWPPSVAKKTEIGLESVPPT